MDKFIITVVVILLMYLCVYAIVNRICKCIEHHTEYKYPSWREFPHTNSNDECCQRKEDD